MGYAPASVGYAPAAAMTTTSSYGAQYAGQAYITQPSATVPTMAAPTLSTPSVAAPMMSAPSISTPPMSSPSMSAPSMNTPTPAPPSSTPGTFQPSGAGAPNQSLMPIPDTDKLNSGSAPKLQDPQNRTTSAQIIGPANVTHAVFNMADRSQVFHPASFQATGENQHNHSNDGWSAGSPTNDDWQPTDGR
jgi:hypothetical protein